MNHKLYGNLIFELSKEGRKGYSLPKNNFGSYEIPASMKRAEEARIRAERRLQEKEGKTDLARASLALQRSIARIEAAKK